MQNVSLPVFGRGFETYHHRQLRNFLFDTNPRLAARLLSRTGSFFASEPDSLRWIPVRMRDENIQIVHALQVKSYISVI